MICSTRWPYLTSNHQVALSQQLGAQPLPFPGMDKSGAAVCEFYVRIHLNQYFETSFPPQGESQLPEGRILSLQARQRGQNYCLQGSSKYGYRNLFDLTKKHWTFNQSWFPFPALVEGLVQEGGSMRVPPRVRHVQDAWVLFLLKIQWVIVDKKAISKDLQKTFLLAT